MRRTSNQAEGLYMTIDEREQAYNEGENLVKKIEELDDLLRQERERAEQYRMAIADAYSQLPEIPNAHGCPICRRFVWTIEDHKPSCLYKILDDALSK